MSWDGYIDSIVGSSKGNCDKACIIGLEGGASWVSGTHANTFTVSPSEAAVIAASLKGDDYASFQSNGILIGGVKYQFLRVDTDEGLALGKKKDMGAVTIHKSISAIIIAHTLEGKSQGDTNTGVAGIINYLKGINM